MAALGRAQRVAGFENASLASLEEVPERIGSLPQCLAGTHGLGVIWRVGVAEWTRSQSPGQPWNKHLEMRTLQRFQLCAGVLVAIAACSCGPSETVAVGNPGDEPGVVRRDIDTARLTQAQANAKVAQDSAELDR